MAVRARLSLSSSSGMQQPNVGSATLSADVGTETCLVTLLFLQMCGKTKMQYVNL